MPENAQYVTLEKILGAENFAPPHHSVMKAKKPSFLKKFVGKVFGSGSSPTHTNSRRTRSAPNQPGGPPHQPKARMSSPNGRQRGYTSNKTGALRPDWPLRNTRADYGQEQAFLGAPAASYHRSNSNNYRIPNDQGHEGRIRMHQVSRGQPIRVPTPPAPVLDRTHRSKRAIVEEASPVPKKSALKHKDPKEKGKAKDIRFNSKVAMGDSAEAKSSIAPIHQTATQPRGPTPPLRRMPPINVGHSVISQRVNSKSDEYRCPTISTVSSLGEPIASDSQNSRLFDSFSSISNHGLSEGLFPQDPHSSPSRPPARHGEVPPPPIGKPHRNGKEVFPLITNMTNGRGGAPTAYRSIDHPSPLVPRSAGMPYQHPELCFSNPYPTWHHEIQNAGSSSHAPRAAPLPKVPPINTTGAFPSHHQKVTPTTTKSSSRAPKSKKGGNKSTPRSLGKTGLSPAPRRMPLPGEAYYSKAPLPPLPIDGEGKVLSAKYPAHRDAGAGKRMPLPGENYYSKAPLPALPAGAKGKGSSSSVARGRR